MYKLLLCLRYLRTRWIALASIISVTLGVATMIVVNSVMAGFRSEMYDRLHGVLSDIVVRSHSLDGIYDPDSLMEEISQVVGDDLEGMTATVQVPAMLNFQVNGKWVTRQVMLTGIDEATYARIGDFDKYLLHEANRKQFGFDLRENGYDERLPECGWVYRRKRVEAERRYIQQLEEIERREQFWRQQALGEQGQPQPIRQEATEPAQGAAAETKESSGALCPLMPLEMDENGHIVSSPEEETSPVEESAESAEPSPPEPQLARGDLDPALPTEDPFAAVDNEEESLFDPMTEQHPGIILGIGIASVRRRNPTDNEVEDVFLCLPGDDVKVTFPTAGAPPQAASDTCTVVDFYECQMVEYDQTFAFVPLRRLQELRGMIHPMTDIGAVTAVQIKLAEGADVNAIAARLQERFPTQRYFLEIQTWMQLQGPLLEAVQTETTILNILLFLIIAVAGFGILATFYMIVVEKTRDIGIMKSLGAPSTGVMSVFLGYGLALGVVGSGVGMVLGLLFVVNINRIAAGLKMLTGREVFDPEIYFLSKIPTIISPAMIAWVVAGAMTIAVLASVLPAIRAARLHPVEALRYE